MKSFIDYSMDLEEAKADLHLAGSAGQDKAVIGIIRTIASDIHPVPALVAADRWLERSPSQEALQARDTILERLRADHPLSAYMASAMILNRQKTRMSSAEENRLPRQILTDGTPPSPYSHAANFLMPQVLALARAECVPARFNVEYSRWKTYIDGLPFVASRERPIARMDAAVATMIVCEFYNATGQTYQNALLLQRDLKALAPFEAFLASLGHRNDKPQTGAPVV